MHGVGDERWRVQGRGEAQARGAPESAARSLRSSSELRPEGDNEHTGAASPAGKWGAVPGTREQHGRRADGTVRELQTPLIFRGLNSIKT